MNDFLKEPTCWAVVSPDWSRCVDELQLAARDISERSHQIVYFNKNTELCCARDEFVSCVSLAGRACSQAAGALLRRMAWVLAQDVAACNVQPRAHCAAPHPPFPPLAAGSFMVLTGALVHPLRF
ncbi:jg16354 [Pararge aegeria aegeria]|uniref:Jg16354 protein n=1 Tax=Pararge aegeria aegeria TaxID=348720 RepID=A0A8S4RVZ2_9NEOP|nr:jg16354 [Pararge aegeria aegeria]